MSNFLKVTQLGSGDETQIHAFLPNQIRIWIQIYVWIQALRGPYYLYLLSVEPSAFGFAK